MSLPTPTQLASISLREARERRRESRFIDEWVRRIVRTCKVRPDHLDDLRAAGALGGARGLRQWEALPEEKRTASRRDSFVARGVVDEVSAYIKRLYGRAAGKRAAALRAATFHPSDHPSIQERFRDILGHLNHETYAGLLHDSLGLESPEDLYLAREQQEHDKDRVTYALSRLDTDEERLFAHRLLIEQRPLKEAAAAIGIHERSKRLRERDKLFKKLKRHVIVFASSVAPRRSSGRGGADSE